MARKVTRSPRKRSKRSKEPFTGEPITGEPAVKDPIINEPAINESAAVPDKGQPQKKTGGRRGKSAKEPSRDEVVQNVPQDVAQKVSPRREVEEIILEGPVFGVPSLIQSSLGNMGNFELVTPLANPGLAYLWRNNDNAELPWYGPQVFGVEVGRFGAASLIQSCFGECGNIELVATDLGGHRIMHFWRDTGPDFRWNGPFFINF
jgi:hypothetical protein